MDFVLGLVQLPIFFPRIVRLVCIAVQSLVIESEVVDVSPLTAEVVTVLNRHLYKRSEPAKWQDGTGV